MMKSLDRLIQNLGYEFKDKSLLTIALRHRSFRANNNERLEFLGDSIVNFVIADALYRRYPHATEGKLSRLRSRLVREEALAQLAKTFSLGDFLMLGPGELKAGGSRRSSILADAMEAVMAAIYLDSNFETCQAIISKWYDSWFEEIALLDESKDAKTELQEYLQAKKKELPHYEVTNISGKSHSQLFHVVCEISRLRLKTEAEGTSRRKAEQAAAKLMLEKLKERS